MYVYIDRYPLTPIHWCVNGWMRVHFVVPWRCWKSSFYFWCEWTQLSVVAWLQHRKWLFLLLCFLRWSWTEPVLAEERPVHSLLDSESLLFALSSAINSKLRWFQTDLESVKGALSLPPFTAPKCVSFCLWVCTVGLCLWCNIQAWQPVFKEREKKKGPKPPTCSFLLASHFSLGSPAISQRAAYRFPPPFFVKWNLKLFPPPPSFVVL